MKIYDSQINFGNNLFGPNSTLTEYLDLSPTEIVRANVIPTATHILNLSEDECEISCIWSNDGKVEFVKKTITPKGEILQYSPKSPYYLMNMMTLEEVRRQNARQSRVKFSFCPKFHPHLDRKNDIADFLSLEETCAVKVQGIATFSTPANIPKWFIELIKCYDLPLIVHTHCNNHNYSQPDRDPYLHYICNATEPLNWAVFALQHDIKIYLAHGMRLCKITAQLVNDHDNFLVGVGPDLLLDEEKHLLYNHSGDYLNNLLEIVDYNKIAYSTDFAWNIYRRGEWREYDWMTHNRIEDIVKNQDSGKYLEKILYSNADKFFSQ
jgi:hypothetical protein